MERDGNLHLVAALRERAVSDVLFDRWEWGVMRVDWGGLT